MSESSASILMVGPDAGVVQLLGEALGGRWEVAAVSGVEDGIGALASPAVSIVIADDALGTAAAPAFLARCARLRPECQRLLIASPANGNDIVDAVNRAGVQGVIRKPVAGAEAAEVIARAAREHAYAADLRRLFERVGTVASEDEARLMGLARDASARADAEKELAEKTREVARLSAELEQFAYAVSHDLQEPLRMVSSYTQILVRRYHGKLDAEGAEFFGFLVDGARRMQVMICELLEYSRVFRKGKPFERAECARALDAALAELRPAIEKTAGAVTHGPLPAVMADQTQLERLFQILIDNALKFHSAAPPRIHVAAEAGQDEWLFSVRDNGIGIDPQFFERIFLVFQRLHTANEYPGTGAGLAIARRIVERHGGRIWVDSLPEKGATFYFTMPDRASKQDAAANDGASSQPAPLTRRLL